MLELAQGFMNSVGIPAFAVLVGVGVWAFFTLLVNGYKLIAGKD